MKSYGITDRGAVRAENQDSYIIENCEARSCVIAAVCDGMGGAKAGDLASRLSCKTFAEKVFEALISKRYEDCPEDDFREILEHSCADANGVVFEYSGFSADYSGMGTTLVGGIITSKCAHIVNIGDSRAYLLNKTGIRQISCDHSYVETLVRMGAIDREEARTHPKRNVITKAIGVERTVSEDYFRVGLRRGDCVLLCSDGLTNMLSDEEILTAYKTEKTPAELCRALMRLALDRGARDNVTVVAVKI